jgi:uncharacterized protein YjiS (DUF1127 family)
MSLIDLSQTLPRRLRDMPGLPALRRWAALRRSREQLARLDDHLLRDIGLTRAQAEREARRPRWDAPEHWRYRP